MPLTVTPSSEYPTPVEEPSKIVRKVLHSSFKPSDLLG